MPWPRNEPDPLENRRRQLEEQTRLLSEQKRLLTEKLHQSGDATVKRIEPPVWKLEDDEVRDRTAEPTPARKKHLARQRQRDMVLFFVFILVLMVVLSILLWVAYVHNTAPAAAA